MQELHMLQWWQLVLEREYKIKKQLLMQSKYRGSFGIKHVLQNRADFDTASRPRFTRSELTATVAKFGDSARKPLRRRCTDGIDRLVWNRLVDSTLEDVREAAKYIIIM